MAFALRAIVTDKWSTASQLNDILKNNRGEKLRDRIGGQKIRMGCGKKFLSK
jgi:hypothetical protein